MKSHKTAVRGWKLFTLRKDGSLGTLFINRRLRIEPGRWYRAEAHRTKGYAFRPGWHFTEKPEAPHLTTRGRVWRRVVGLSCEALRRPESQGGRWWLAGALLVCREKGEAGGVPANGNGSCSQAK